MSKATLINNDAYKVAIGEKSWCVVCLKEGRNVATGHKSEKCVTHWREEAATKNKKFKRQREKRLWADPVE